MHNLEEKIADWRKWMAAGGVITPAVLDELESHLREDVERQIKLRISQEQAFAAAARRIGQSDLLKAEFAKVGGFAEARPGKVIGMALCVLASAFALWATPSLFTIREMTLGQRLLGFAAVAVTLLAVASWRFSHNYLPVIRNRRLRMSAGVACSVAGVLWLYAFGGLLLNVIVPRVLAGSRAAPTENFFPAFAIGISFLWAIALAAVLGAIAYGLEEAARRANQRVSN